MQIKHTIDQTNIRNSKTHDFGGIKIISRQIHNTNGLNLFFFFFGSRLCVPHRFRLRFTPPPYPYEEFFARLACLQGHGETNEARRKHCIPGTITEA